MKTKDLITAIQDYNTVTYAIDSKIVVGYYKNSFLMTLDCFAGRLKDLTKSNDAYVSIGKEKLLIELQTPQNLAPILQMLVTFNFEVIVNEEGIVRCCVGVNKLNINIE